MAFTFAHPAAVIPLHKYRNRFHPAALVLGASCFLQDFIFVFLTEALADW